MRRKRHHHRDTKVWHDPHVTPAGRKRSERPSNKGSARQENQENARVQKRRNGGRIIAGVSKTTDPRAIERERLLHRVLAAEGRPLITRAANDFFEAGFDLPRTQDAWLQILEHNDEDRVAQAITQLSTILDEEEPKRRSVLDSRLRRIAEFADEPCTQKAASELRRLLSGK